MTQTLDIVDGAPHSVAIAQIASDVLRWSTKLPERIDQLHAAMPTYRNWLALLDGRQVGEAMCLEPPDMRESKAAFGEICVLEDARRRGVGTALFGHVSEHARSLGKTELEINVFADDPGGVEFAERREFHCIMRVRSLRLVLADCPVPAVEPPDGVTITTLAERPELAHGVWEVAVEAIPDIPIDSDVPMHPGTFEEFQEFVLSGVRYIPEATFVALLDGETIGYGQLSWQDPSRGIAAHDMLAVRRAFRGRKIGRVLKTAQISWAIENGLTELRTGNEERNAPVRALNATFPYEPIPDALLYRGPLAPP